MIRLVFIPHKSRDELKQRNTIVIKRNICNLYCVVQTHINRIGEYGSKERWLGTPLKTVNQATLRRYGVPWCGTFKNIIYTSVFNVRTSAGVISCYKAPAVSDNIRFFARTPFVLINF